MSKTYISFHICSVIRMSLSLSANACFSIGSFTLPSSLSETPRQSVTALKYEESPNHSQELIRTIALELFLEKAKIGNLTAVGN